MIWKDKSVQLLIENSGKKDPIEIIRDKARSLVLSAFNEGWNGPPFDPIQLARILELTVLPNENILDARIIPDRSGNNIIEYNPYQKETRINFSIAHEIGHTFFPDFSDRIHNRENDKDSSNWELEFLCDIAAAELLLPYAEFTVEANSVALNLNSLLEISRKYRASVESVFLRFCEVVDKPCTIILASFLDEKQENLRIDYVKSSQSASLQTDIIKEIPKGSSIYECLNPGWTAFKTEEWSIFNNSRYSIYSVGLPPIKKQQVSRVGAILVPEFYSEVSDEHIYVVNGDATKPRGDGNKIIVQLVNTSGGLGFGFGRAMSKSWPESKNIIKRWIKSKEDFILGNSKLNQLNDNTYVFQMIAQKGLFPKAGEIPLKYDSLNKCLIELSKNARFLNASVHMPKIGVGQAKGDWNIIKGMIQDELISKGVSVTVYILPGSEVAKPSKLKTLTLFNED